MTLTSPEGTSILAVFVLCESCAKPPSEKELDVLEAKVRVSERRKNFTRRTHMGPNAIADLKRFVGQHPLVLRQATKRANIASIIGLKSADPLITNEHAACKFERRSGQAESAMTVLRRHLTRPPAIVWKGVSGMIQQKAPRAFLFGTPSSFAQCPQCYTIRRLCVSHLHYAKVLLEALL